MDKVEKYHFFWKSKLSNWTTSYFTVNNIKYCCGEQYMMHSKAILFKDFEIASKILLETNPRIIKGLGRLVKNFNNKIWNDKKYEIVKYGLQKRFEQDSEFHNELLKYKSKILVEASPYDRIWGIGYSKEHALDNIANWGENLLGKILTEICNESIQTIHENKV